MRILLASLIGLLGPAASAQESEGLEALVQTTRDGDGFSVREVITVTASEGGRSETSKPVPVHVERSPDGRGRVDVRGFTAFIGPDTVRVIHESNPSACVTLDHDGRPLPILRGLFSDLPSIWLTLGFGRPDASGNRLAGLLRAAPGLAALPRSGDGPDEVDFKLAGEGVSGRFDPRLPGRLLVEVSEGPWVPEGALLRWESEISSASPRGTDFEPGDRRSLDRIGALVRSAGPVRGGDPARSMALPLLDGGRFDLEERLGAIVVIDFWASWCGPCRAALPVLSRLAAERGEELVVVTVNTSEREQDAQRRGDLVRAAREEIGFELPVAIDLDGAVARQWGVAALPTTVVIAPDGEVALVLQGAGPEYERTLSAEIDALSGR